MCALLALFLVAGCADLERGPAPPTPDAAPDGSAGDAQAGGFAAARAVLLANCAGCHEPGKTAGKTDFLLGGDEAADYAAAHMFVDVGNPAASRLLVKASGQGHGGGLILTAGSPEYATLLAWIEGGAGP
jgi:mono/diheme cytochrome c family protein